MAASAGMVRRAISWRATGRPRRPGRTADVRGRRGIQQLTASVGAPRPSLGIRAATAGFLACGSSPDIWPSRSPSGRIDVGLSAYSCGGSRRLGRRIGRTAFPLSPRFRGPSSRASWMTTVARVKSAGGAIWRACAVRAEAPSPPSRIRDRASGSSAAPYGSRWDRWPDVASTASAQVRSRRRVIRIPWRADALAAMQACDKPSRRAIAFDHSDACEGFCHAESRRTPSSSVCGLQAAHPVDGLPQLVNGCCPPRPPRLRVQKNFLWCGTIANAIALNRPGDLIDRLGLEA